MNGNLQWQNFTPRLPALGHENINLKVFLLQLQLFLSSLRSKDSSLKLRKMHETVTESYYHAIQFKFTATLNAREISPLASICYYYKDTEMNIFL
jgi:hypothetical protein